MESAIILNHIWIWVSLLAGALLLLGWSAGQGVAHPALKKRRWTLRGATRSMARGERAFEAGRYHRARHYLERAKTQYNNLGAWEEELLCLISLGRVYSRLADKIAALACIEKVLSQQPSQEVGIRYQALMAKAIILQEHGDPERALETFSEAMNTQDCPRDFPVTPAAQIVRETVHAVLLSFLHRGRQLARLGQYELARDHYRHGLAILDEPALAKLELVTEVNGQRQLCGLLSIELDRLNETVSPTMSSRVEPPNQVALLTH